MACECGMAATPPAPPADEAAATCVEADADELVDVADAGDVVPEAVVGVPKLLFAWCITRGEGIGDSAGVQSSDMEVANRLHSSQEKSIIVENK